MRIVPDGIVYASALALVAVVIAVYLSVPWAGVCLCLAAFCLYFFRDPDRQSPAGPSLLSPADGRVVGVLSLPDGSTRISIFLNIFDVHVNRTPVAGRVREVSYSKGRFLVASREQASLENEQNTLVIDSAWGAVICRQIAGLIARRIVCYKQPGDDLDTGERIGYIKFGSRVDVIFSAPWLVTVKTGERVQAGLSVLAEVRS